jgi:quinol monooxygenase YgiN
MLIIAGTFDVDPDRRDEFIAGREAAMRRARDEPGCLGYVFAADPLVPGRVQLFERWESKDDLAAHSEVNRTAPPPTANAVPVIAMEIVQYEISASGPVGS